MSEQLLADLERDEGYRAGLYLDTVNKLTFAIGRNLEDMPLTGREWRELYDAGEISVSISLAGARRLLKGPLAALEIQLARTFTWWVSLDSPRKLALLNVAYNIGLPRLLGFQKMLAAIQAGDFEAAAAELLNSRYAQQVGARAQRLANILRTGTRP